MVLELKLLKERHHVGYESIFLIHLFASIFPGILHLSEVSAQENGLRVAGDPTLFLGFSCTSSQDCNRRDHRTCPDP